MAIRVPISSKSGQIVHCAPSPGPRQIPPRTSLHLHKFGIGATRDLNIGMAAPARPVTQQDVSNSKVSSIKGGKVTLMVSSRLQALFKVSKETSENSKTQGS